MSCVCCESQFRLLVHRPSHHRKRDGRAKGVDKIARRRRVVQILDNDGQVAHRERQRRGHQKQQQQRQEERQREGAPIANDLRQLFTGLRENASHFSVTLSSGAATLPSCRAFSTTPMNTSSMENWPSRICRTRIPFDSNFSLVAFSPAATSSSVITWRRSPNSEIRHGSVSFLSRSEAFCG